MAAVEAIRGYLPVAPFHTTGGGHCQWTFARKGGRDYFLKRFLSPTYPLPDGPGSAKTKANKRIRCERFEAHHKAVHDRLAPLSGEGGNLIVSRDFFRHGPHYYKVTDKVDVSSETPADIAALPDDENFKILLAVTHSLDILHTHGLVHGDVKPTNILVQRDGSALTTKLIDFDNCFISGHPAPPEEIVGDLWYYPPEMTEYMTGGGAGSRLTTKSDIFALGLVFAEYVTGHPPSFPPATRYPGEALRHGATLTVHRVAGREALEDLVENMLCPDPAQRPTCREIRDAVQRIRRSARCGSPAPGPARAPGPASGRAPGPASGRAPGPASGLDAAFPPGLTAATGPTGGLRGRLWERLRDRADRGDAEPGTGDGKAGDSKAGDGEPDTVTSRLRGRLIRKVGRSGSEG